MANSYMYILKCNDDSYYVGSTKDMGKRFWEHQHGTGSEYTSQRLPLQLVYIELFSRIDYAFNREHQIKGWTRKKKETLIKGDTQQLISLSKKAF